MGSEAAVPAEGEVRAVAELLGLRPDELSVIKLPGPGQIGESVLSLFAPMPELEGFSPPQHIDIAWDGNELRVGARYDSSNGSLIVVSHETGPLFYFGILGGAAAAVDLIRAAYALMQWVRTTRVSRGAAEFADVEPIQFWFVEDGREKAREVLPLEAPE